MALKDRLARQYAWAKASKHFYEFDFSSIYAVLAFQLSRMYGFMSGPDAVAVHKKLHIKMLKKAAVLAQQLVDDDFGKQYYNIAESVKDKYVEFNHEQAGKCLLPTLAYSKAFDRAWKVEEKEREAAKKKLFNIIQKYSNSWWD